MEWTNKDLDKDTEELQPKSEDEMIVKGVNRGRPSSSNTVKTNLDLSIEVIMELNEVAECSNFNHIVLSSLIRCSIGHHKMRLWCLIGCHKKCGRHMGQFAWQ